MKLQYDEPLSNFAFNSNLRRYGKAQIAAGQRLPTEGKVFISVRDGDKVSRCGLNR